MIVYMYIHTQYNLDDSLFFVHFFDRTKIFNNCLLIVWVCEMNHYYEFNKKKIPKKNINNNLN